MFNLSGSEVIFILLAGLVVLGPEKLPGAIRQFGRIYAELRRMGNGFQSELRSALDEPMREIRETADLARGAVMKPFGDDAPGVADIKPRTISESVRRMLEGSDGPATAEEVESAVVAGDMDPVLAADLAMRTGAIVIPEDEETDDSGAAFAEGDDTSGPTQATAEAAEMPEVTDEIEEADPSS